MAWALRARRMRRGPSLESDRKCEKKNHARRVGFGSDPLEREFVDDNPGLKFVDQTAKANADMQESLRATSASAGASLLAEHGVCWLDAALAPAALRSVADEARSSFTALLSAISGRHEAVCRGLPAHLHRLARMPVKCAEVVERDGGRFDCRYGCDGLPQLLLGPATLLARLLAAVLGDELAVVAHGQVVALSEEGRAHYLSEEAPRRAAGMACGRSAPLRR